MAQYSSTSLIIYNCLQNVSNALILSLPFGGLQRRPSLFLPLPVCADSSSHQGVEFILPPLNLGSSVPTLTMWEAVKVMSRTRLFCFLPLGSLTGFLGFFLLESNCHAVRQSKPHEEANEGELGALVNSQLPGHFGHSRPSES